MAPGARDTSPDRETVVHRIECHDTAGQLARRVAERPHAAPAGATAESSSDRDDPTGGSGASHLVEWSVPDGGGDPLIEAVPVGRSGPAGIPSAGRDGSPGGGAVPAPAAR